MSTLNELRSEAVAALEDLEGVQTYGYLPEAVAAPALVLVPGSPYVSTDGEPFRHYKVRLTFLAVADVAPNEEATKALDELLTKTVLALSAAGFLVEEIAEPYAFQSNTAIHLAAELTFSDSIDFQEEN